MAIRPLEERLDRLAAEMERRFQVTRELIERIERLEMAVREQAGARRPGPPDGPGPDRDEPSLELDRRAEKLEAMARKLREREEQLDRRQHELDELARRLKARDTERQEARDTPPVGERREGREAPGER